MAKPFTADDLFEGGTPRSRDIQQDNLRNCYFLAPLGAIADTQPDLIQIAHNARTTEFTVGLFKEGKRVEYTVTQAELRNNFKRGGGSIYDNRREGPIWPAVYEVAFAKSLDSNLADGLAEGWRKLYEPGFSLDAMDALTGSPGDVLSLEQAAILGTDKTLQQLRDALAKDRPVVLNTKVETGSKEDGLVDHHSYIVKHAYVDEKGQASLELRNPWGADITNDEGVEDTLKLADLLRAGGLSYFNIGPAPAARTLSPDRSKGVPGSMDKLPTSLKQVIGMLNEMVDTIGAPNGETALASASRALGNLPAAQEFSLQGKREAELVPAQLQSESLRVTPRLGMVQTQRIGGM